MKHTKCLQQSQGHSSFKKKHLPWWGFLSSLSLPLGMWGDVSTDVHLQSDTGLHRHSLQGALSIAHVSQQHWDPCRQHFAAGPLCPGSTSLNQTDISQEQEIGSSNTLLDRDAAPLTCLGFSNATNGSTSSNVCTLQKLLELWSQSPAAVGPRGWAEG